MISANIHKAERFAEVFKVLKNRQECIQTLGSDFAIANAVSEKALYKLDRGIYSDRPYVPFVEIAAKRYPNAVVTLDSAFYYQGLTDVVTRSGCPRVPAAPVAQQGAKGRKLTFVQTEFWK